MIENLLLIARGGGGGSGDGGGVGGIIAVPIIIVGLILTWRYRRKKIKKAKADQTEAQSTDSSWSPEVIETRVEEVFNKFQKDWSSFKLASMRTYLTPSYSVHMEYVVRAMQQLGRINILQNIKLEKIILFNVRDSSDSELDEFDAEIDASLHDIIQQNDSQKIFSEDVVFQELWHFERQNNEWCLGGITQKSSKDLVIGYHDKSDNDYVKFAQANSLYYNADFGWLLLPMHGALFGEAKFGTSNINHHTIGEYKGRIVQFFEYVPVLEEKRFLSGDIAKLFKRDRRVKVAEYAVGQITLPKNYGNIVVERKNFLDRIGLSYRPSGMNKIRHAPLQFEKKYVVYASDEEQATSFELLHPAYLEKLINLDFSVDIEVVGDNLYLYSSDKVANFDELLQLLCNAYDELER